jgi:hypothetical protein
MLLPPSRSRVPIALASRLTQPHGESRIQARDSLWHLRMFPSSKGCAYCKTGYLIFDMPDMRHASPALAHESCRAHSCSTARGEMRAAAIPGSAITVKAIIATNSAIVITTCAGPAENGAGKPVLSARKAASKRMRRCPIAALSPMTTGSQAWACLTGTRSSLSDLII